MNFSLNIHALDGMIVVFYLLAVLSFGRWIGRGQRTSTGYFLGGRSLPWGAFLTAATHGTDQLMVQRYLCARNQRDASRALACSGLIVSGQFALFLLIGVGLATFHTLAAEPGTLTSGDGDRLFAHFIVNTMPVGLVGFTLASVFAAAMSTLSSSLNSSATALVNDVYLPLRKHELSPHGQLSAGLLIQLVLSRGKPEAVR